MKMSPWRSQGVLQGGIAVIEGNAPVESLTEVDFGSGKAEALALLWDRKALALPLDDVVIADQPLMDKATDAVQIFRSRAPCSLHFTRTAGEGAVIVGHEITQHDIGGLQLAGLSQPEVAGTAIR